MSFAIYFVGVLIAIGGLVYAGNLLGLSGQWMAAGAIVLLGLAILSGVKATRQKDAA
jgi:hypothetical protein